MDDLDKLTESFKRFPGVGPRQARRMVYYLFRQRASWVNETAQRMQALKDRVHLCSSCNRHFLPKAEGAEACAICENPARDRSRLMLLEKDVDLENIEKSGIYDGLYFVLGGTVNLMDERTAEFLAIDKLKSIVAERLTTDELAEITLACSTSPAGEETARFVLDALEGMIKDARDGGVLSITRLGRGLSTGAELEYADAETLKNAFQNRK